MGGVCVGAVLGLLQVSWAFNLRAELPWAWARRLPYGFAAEEEQDPPAPLDRGAALKLVAALGAFALHHSVFARGAVKRWWACTPTFGRAVWPE